MYSEGNILHVGPRIDAQWGKLPPGTQLVKADDVNGASGANADGSRDVRAVVVRMDELATHGRDATMDSCDGCGNIEPSTKRPRITVALERYPSVPVLAYTEDDDADAAIDVSRLGAEYVSGRRLSTDGETVADRVASLIGRTGSFAESPTTTSSAGSPAGSRTESGGESRDESRGESRTGSEGETRTRSRSDPIERAAYPVSDPNDAARGGGTEAFFESFTKIVTNRAGGFEGTIDDLLRLGREHLDLSIGFVSRTDADRFTLLHRQGATDLGDRLVESGEIAPDGSVPLATTYCRRTIEGDDVLAFSNASATDWVDDPAYEAFGVETYIGGRVVVENDVLGTLCFADESPRNRGFSTIERTFVELLATWVGREFERARVHEERETVTARLEETLERIDDGFFALDDEWTITYANGEAATILSAHVEEISGSNAWSTLPNWLGSSHERLYQEAMETQQSVSFEEHIESADRWMEVTVYPSEGGVSVFVRDVTERNRREETLRQLLRATEGLQLAEDEEAIADRLVRASGGILDLSISGVRLYDEASDSLDLVSMSEELTNLFGDREPCRPGEGIVGRAFSTGEHQVCGDLESLFDDREYYGVRSAISVPLGTHGTFTVGSTEANAFDDQDVSVVQLLATNATAAMSRVDRQSQLITYERALENVDDMVCVVDDGVVTFATRPFAEWLDMKRVDLLGKDLASVVPTEARSAIESAVTGLFDSGEVETVELHVDGRNGSSRRGTIRLSALSPSSKTAVGSVTDTTELDRTRAELMSERDRFRRLFEQIPDPILEVSYREDDTIVRAVNEAFEERFGYDESTIVGSSAFDLDLRYDHQREAVDEDGRSVDDRIREEGFLTEERRLRTVDGPREFLFRGFTYDAADGTRSFGIYTDITVQKHREQYLQIANRILRHNLRNEMNVVFGFASEINRIADDEQVIDYAERIEATGKRLSKLGEGAAEIKRIVENGLESEPEALPIRPIATRVAERFMERYPGTAIEVSVPESLRIRGDPRFEDVLDQLVENAIVHADREALNVEITVDPADSAGYVSITVADDGPGMPPSVRELVTGDREVTQLQHNSGIGLWIVAWVADAYGGTIEFDAGIDGNGSAVTLRLPTPD